MPGERTDTPARGTSGRVTVTCGEVLDLVGILGDGLVVGELQGQQQVVIKSSETNCGRIEGLAGATILGDGSVAFILDMVGLVRLARQGTRAARAVGGNGDAIDSDASGGGRTTRAARGASRADLS